MRRFLLHSLILVFAASGIACACPTDIVAAELPQHEMHSMHGGEQPKDCCEDCDESSAMHADSLPVVIDIRFLQDNFEQSPALLPVAIDVDWALSPSSERSPPDSPQFLPFQTPVNRHDRMLD